MVPKRFKNPGRLRFYLYFGVLSLTAIVIIAVAVPKIILSERAASSNSGSAQKAGNSYDRPGFDINTDWDTTWPDTGVTRTYIFNLTEVDQYIGGDGVPKANAMLINGQFPGPLIRADWGDKISVTVYNNLRSNGTSLHWHGFRQLNNNINDGVAGVTECPIPPGHSKTYSFQATQYGTSWYHSHISSQYANGLVGPIHIDGPASCDYDIDLGVFPISDWYYSTADNLLDRVFDANNPFVPGLPGSPPPSDNILFNGTNINPYGGPGGSYAKVAFTPGKRHRLRLINTSVDNTFTVSIVGHSMTIIATDFVPVQPYPADSVYLSVGQRLDVVIDANQEIGTYWLNATFSSAKVCGSSTNQHPAAIVQYDGAPWWLPGNPGSPPRDSYCADDISPIPVIPSKPPVASFTASPADTLNVSLALNTTISKVYWQVNGSAMDIMWDKPTLQYILDGDREFPRESNIIELPNKSEWSFWLIQNISPIPHPMHLHGHDFIIVGRSDALQSPLDSSNAPTPFNPANDAWRLTRTPNPIRRDTTVLPAYGWLVVAFQNSNPGAWVFHCHIAWHISQGLSVQFLERSGDVISAMDVGDELGQTCPAWKAYAPTDPFTKTDSGV